MICWISKSVFEPLQYIVWQALYGETLPSLLLSGPIPTLWGSTLIHSNSMDLLLFKLQPLLVMSADYSCISSGVRHMCLRCADSLGEKASSTSSLSAGNKACHQRQRLCH